MPFSRNDNFRIIIRLGLKISDYEIVSNKINKLELISELIVGKIQEILEKLDELDRQLTEVCATPNFAIIQADVLTYGEKQKPYGILMEMLRNTQILGDLIEINPNLSLINDQLALVGAPPINTIVGTINRS